MIEWRDIGTSGAWLTASATSMTAAMLVHNPAVYTVAAVVGAIDCVVYSNLLAQWWRSRT